MSLNIFMFYLPNSASSVLSCSVASPSLLSSFLESSRSLSSTPIGCMSTPLGCLSSLESALSRPCSDERDVLAAGKFLAVTLVPSMTCSIGEAVGRLLTVRAAEELSSWPFYRQGGHHFHTNIWLDIACMCLAKC